MRYYMLSVIQPEGDGPPPELRERITRDNDALVQEIMASGAWDFGGGLHPLETATVVRVPDGEVLTTDGPFAEGKEHLGGVLVVRAPDLDAALDLARKRSRATTLPIEVRPFDSAAEGRTSAHPASPTRRPAPGLRALSSRARLDCAQGKASWRARPRSVSRSV